MRPPSPVAARFHRKCLASHPLGFARHPPAALLRSCRHLLPPAVLLNPGFSHFISLNRSAGVYSDRVGAFEVKANWYQPLSNDQAWGSGAMLSLSWHPPYTIW